MEADPWQQTVLKSWMRRTCHDKWAATIWGLSVPRQNGKNGALEVFELFAMAILGLKILHTAHEVKTARKAFRRLKQFFGETKNDKNATYPELNALVKEIRNTNGQEAIELHNGGLVEFVARSKGSGRGYTSDVLVLDEAQDLQEAELQALKPAISSAPSGQPVTIYMGTPPEGLEEKGEPFVRIRSSALKGKSKRTAYLEWSPAGDIDKMKPDEMARFAADKANWAEANPALGIRMFEDTIDDELTSFSAASFLRERLNMWPQSRDGSKAFSMESWNELLLEEVPVDWPLAAIGLDMNPERTRVTMAAAVFAPDDCFHLELIDDVSTDDQPVDLSTMSERQIADWLWRRCKKRVPIVMDAFSPIRSLEASLKRKGMRVYVLGAAEFSQACGMLDDSVHRFRSISHFGQEQLDDSIEGTTKEKFGKAGAFKFNRTDFSVDLTPTMATTCALFGAKKFGRRPAARKKTRGAIAA
nr:terminase large subunit [Zhihengliuella flava]